MEFFPSDTRGKLSRVSDSNDLKEHLPR